MTLQQLVQCKRVGLADAFVPVHRRFSLGAPKDRLVLSNKRAASRAALEPGVKLWGIAQRFQF